jgi:hypothetical protein
VEQAFRPALKIATQMWASQFAEKLDFGWRSAFSAAV